jgi:hypothetical protein
MAFDAAALGGIQKVRLHVEGNVIDVTETLLVDTDVNGKARRQQGFFFQFDTASFTSVNINGTARIYAEAFANDGTIQNRVIGPFEFYPRTSDFDGTSIVRLDGTGNHTSIDAALADLIGQGKKAGQVLITQTGFYELNNVPGAYTGNQGHYRIEASSGVTATLGHASLPDDQFNAAWNPGLDGVEFRGAGIVLEMQNVSAIGGAGSCLRVSGGANIITEVYSGTGSPHWFNGCIIKNTPGRDSLHWYGIPHSQGFTSITNGVQDCAISDIPNALGETVFASANRITNDLWSCSAGMQTSSYQNVTKNTSSSYWFANLAFNGPLEPEMQIKYTGGFATSCGTHGNQLAQYSADYFFHIIINGVQTNFRIGTKQSDANFTWAQLVTSINTTLGASGIVAQVASGARGISPLACEQTTFTLSSTFQNIAPYLDFHQDFFHSGYNENLIVRGCTVDHEGYTYTGAWALTFYRIAGQAHFYDIALIDNSCDQAQSAVSAYSVAVASHLLEMGTTYAYEGYAIPNTGDAYTICESNVADVTWDIGTVSAPFCAQRRNYFVTGDPLTTSAAFPGPYNTNNTLASFSDQTARLAGQLALVPGHTNGDFRPAGALASTLIPRPHSAWDQQGYARATNDAAGSVSINTPAPQWPFAP